ncbi:MULTISPECIES: hypothetical protein [unclassified Erwinia]|uniref:hypothetical protein n=1 Tax=unclassified Erwinia TaxID=2622719 RepID=UPI000A442070|nr:MULTISPECIES: hypothetical protein [unclassified Erwinia]
MIIRRSITSVEINPHFDEVSLFFGFDKEVVESYEEDLLNLIELWLQQGFVDVYQHGDLFAYGMVKDSNSTTGSSPWYIGINHTRVDRTDVDPLLVVTFRDEHHDGGIGTMMVLHNLISHDEMFGSLRRKYDRDYMRSIRERLSGQITR